MHLVHRDEDTWNIFMAGLCNYAAEYDFSVRKTNKTNDGMQVLLIDDDDEANKVVITLRFFECEGFQQEFVEVSGAYNKPVYVTANPKIVFSMIYA